MIQKFRKKPVIIEAIKFETDNEAGDINMNEIIDWINQGKNENERYKAWHDGTNIHIETLEGTMRADCFDWIIKGVKGEFYPCKPDIFEETYEKVWSDPDDMQDTGEEQRLQ